MTRFSPLLAAALLALPAVTSSQEPQDAAAIQAIRQSGGQVLELAQNDPRLDVAFHLSNVELTPEHLKALEGVKGRITHLNVRGTNLNDDLAQYLKPLTELTRLHLERTAISDAALANLAGMQKLEYLNVYGTNVTDAGLEHLGGLSGLKKLYVWETKVTLDGVRKLKQRLPELQIIGGPEEPKPATPQEPVVAPKPAKP
ncbi:MAG TPA: hypothetical protein VF170_20165 [Planctomycetaceae bacterium]